VSLAVVDEEKSPPKNESLDASLEEEVLEIEDEIDGERLYAHLEQKARDEEECVIAHPTPLLP